MSWQTIPELIDDSCARYRDLEALVDGDVRLTFAELGARVDEAARAHMAWGIDPGDRFAVWAPNIWEWPIVGARRPQAPARVLVPINTRFKGREAAYVLRKSKARSPVHGHRLPRHRLRVAAARQRARSSPISNRSWCCAVRCPRAASRSPSSSRAGCRGRRPRHAARDPPRSPVTISATSSSRRARPARRRARCWCTRRSARRTSRGPTWSGCARGDRYLVVNPVPPLVRAALRHPRLPHEGRVQRAAPGVRRPDGDEARARGAHLGAARSARDLPDDPQPSRPRRASTCRRCGSRSPVRRRCRSR